MEREKIDIAEFIYVKRLGPKLQSKHNRKKAYGIALCMNGQSKVDK